MTKDKKTLSETLRTSAPLSRRNMLRGTAIAAGGATLLAATLTASAARAEAGKVSQADAAYQATPKDGQRCDGCKLFVAPASCSAVSGTISPSGWCKLYTAKG